MYQVRVKPAGSAAWTSSLNANTPWITLPSLTPATAYDVELAAYYGGGKWSQAASLTVMTAPEAASGALNRADRNSVASSWADAVDAGYTPSGFTGSTVACEAGTTSAQYQSAVLGEINWYRQMAGLPAVTLDASATRDAQAGALMLAAKGQLSHVTDASWPCRTQQAADAAGRSVIAFGGVSELISDDGAGNEGAGHRGVLQSPRLVSVGIGQAMKPGGSAPALVITPNTARSNEPGSPGYVAWPAAGQFPAQALPFSGRWSFKILGLGSEFWDASVTVTKDGETVDAPIVSTRAGGLVWQMPRDDANPSAPDARYDIRISNVMIAGVPTTYDYTVTVFHGL